MRIATVTPMYNSEFFVRAFCKQISIFDENIILMGRKPFKDYLEAGKVKEERDKTEQILRDEFPYVRIYYHDFDYYCGELFNMGMEIAESLGCDVVFKAEPDMFMTWKDLINFKHRIRTLDYEILQLYFQKNTMTYIKDFEHGVTQALWDVGNDPFVVKVGHRFIVHPTQIRILGHSVLIDWDDFMIHHFSGFNPTNTEETWKQIEQRKGFIGWSKCPQEIIDLFNV